MIRKSMPSGYDPMGGYRFSLATNAKRLRGDHAQTKRWSAMTIRGKVIALQVTSRVDDAPSPPGAIRLPAGRASRNLRRSWHRRVRDLPARRGDRRVASATVQG